MPYSNKSEGNAKKREQNRRRRAFVNKLKDVPCADCGQKFPPVCMDFDHVRGAKEFSIAHKATTVNLDSLLEEVEKCEVVCACCHRLRTMKRIEKKLSDG